MLQGAELVKVDNLNYKVINGSCRVLKEIVQAGWSGWRRVSGVICDRKMLAKTKKNVYKTVGRPAMLYRLDSVVMTKTQETELELA